MTIFAGKVALITGAARGIGRATVLKLAQAGCDIVINYYSSHEEASTLAKEVEQLGRKVLTIQASVADAQSVKEMMSAITNEFGRIDFLISNAASGVLKPALEMKLKHWRWCLETNAYALNLLVQEAGELLQPQGRVIALSSLGSERAIPNYAFIGASKAAVESLVRSLSLELAPRNINVNCVSAGVIDTDAIKYFPNREQLLEAQRQHTLCERDLIPEDVANTIYLLCLPEAEMIKGQTITVDAGYSIVG